MSLVTGTRLGPYEIQSALGAGGMGEVYRARDTRLDRAVAIKVLSSEHDVTPEMRDRFEHEARTISNLSHPHICTLYDVGQHDGTDFLVMEYLEGETLERRLQRGPLPLDQLLKLGIEIADALSAAHRQGVVHRDLKPANVMLTRSGAKLMDFGLAKLHSEAVPAVTALTEMATAASKKLTAEGMIVGTFQYMAPEQLEGSEITPRTDIFCFGAVLYEMATGTPAFAGKTKASLIAAVLSSEPKPLAEAAPMSPPALERVVRTCLAKDPEDRWQTAHDLKLQLQWIAEAGSQAGVPAAVATRRKSRDRVMYAVAALALAAAAAFGLAYRASNLRANRVLHAQITVPENVIFNIIGDNSGAPVLSPDGKYLVFSGTGQGSNVLFLRAVDSDKAQPLNGTEGATFPFWAPDGQNIGFFVGGKLVRMSVLGGPMITLADATGGRGGAWSKDGTILFAPVFRGGLARVSASGGKVETVTTLDNANFTTHRWPVFLADGKHFLYLAANHNNPGSQETGLYCGSLDGKESRFVIHTLAGAAYASGYLLYLSGSTLLAQPISASCELAGQPVAVADPVMDDTGVWRAVVTASESGMLLYQPGMPSAGMRRLTWFDRSGKRLGNVGEPGTYFQLQLAPGGKKLAVDVGDPSSAIWIFDLQRQTRTRLTFEPGIHISFAWSPDGKRLAYAATGPGGGVVPLIKNSDGAGRSELLLGPNPDATYVPTSWSPDGRYLLMDRGDAGLGNKAEIYILSLNGDRKPQPYLATHVTGMAGQFSPDGKWITYVSEESGRPEVYVAPFPATGAKWQISNNSGIMPRWRHDGKELFYRTATDGQMYAVEVNGSGPNFEIGPTRPLFRVTMNGTGFLWDIAPDGQRLIINETPSENSQPLNLVVNWTEELKKK